MSNARNIASIAGEDVLNASNEIVPVYACRAWVNFDGTSELSGDGLGNDNSSPTAGEGLVIRGSGNVSSCIFNATGNFTVNFESDMPSTNYCVNVSAKQDESGLGTYVFGSFYAGSGATVSEVFKTGSVRVTCNLGNSTALYPAVVMCVAIFC